MIYDILSWAGVQVFLRSIALKESHLGPLKNCNIPYLQNIQMGLNHSHMERIAEWDRRGVLGPIIWYEGRLISVRSVVSYNFVRCTQLIINIIYNFYNSTFIYI